MNPTFDATGTVERIRGLFDSMRTEESVHNIRTARGIERQIRRLVTLVAKHAPNTAEHADALAYHEYAMLSLSRTTKRADMRKKFTDRAYELGAQSVDIRLAGKKRDLGTGFAAYNLAIDLIVSHNRPAEGLKYMLAARRIIKALPRNKRPRNFNFFWIDYGIAKAHNDLGQTDEARQVLRRTLGPELNAFDFGDLRGLAKSAELLAEMKLAQRSK